jgi:TolB-like protein/class 3 adenylate cyclase/Tfp pilus assembly protein PilF
MSQTRRLAAILAADVAGYSRLMGADEEGTHERLHAHLRELVNPKVEEHRGRIVKNTGDGFLAEFASVVDAVRCAVEIQCGMAEREPEVPEERRIKFRIGINLGDVIVEKDDIFGDGVNVAARLEGLAEPGGICVSRVVRDQVRDRLDYAFEDLGERQVKNIVRPVRVYAVLREPTRALTAAGAVVIPETAAAPRLSIVVLPFANLSNDPEQQYFADGITEDLTADLSRIAGMLVISRNTAFTYQGKRVDTKQIGRELSVRYVLEGSVRRLGNQIRINAQLIDAEKDMHLWAERFNGDTSDLFTLQDEITRRIAVALNLELWRAEAARPTRRPDAVDYIFRGRAVLLGGPPSRERYAEAIALFKQALALDPQSVDAQSFLAGVLAGRVIDNMADTTAADIVYADSLIGQALAASPRSCFAHYARGHVLRAQRRYAEAIPEYEAALSANPNYVYALHGLASCKVRTGSIEEAIPLEEQAIRLSPRDPFIGPCYMLIGVVHLLLSNADEAIVWFEKACNHAPAHPNICAYLASAYALAGETDRAAAAVAEARRLSGDDRYTSITRLKGAPGYWGAASVTPLFEATYFAGLRKAGMPEE